MLVYWALDKWCLGAVMLSVLILESRSAAAKLEKWCTLTNALAYCGGELRPRRKKHNIRQHDCSIIQVGNSMRADTKKRERFKIRQKKVFFKFGAPPRRRLPFRRQIFGRRKAKKDELTNCRPNICSADVFWSSAFCPDVFQPNGFVRKPFGQVSFGQVSFGQVSFGQVSFGQVSFGQMSFGQVSFGQVTFSHVS